MAQQWSLSITFCSSLIDSGFSFDLNLVIANGAQKCWKFEWIILNLLITWIVFHITQTIEKQMLPVKFFFNE